MTNRIINIIMADDHEIFRDGFAVMFRKPSGIKLVADARNGHQLVMLAEKFKPDVILTDIKMPGMDGIEATSILTAKLPQAAIIALSMFDDESLVLDMLRAGAKGYLLKNAHKKEIIQAIHTVNDNKPYYCSQISARLARLIVSSGVAGDGDSLRYAFSEKEMEIIRLICREFTNDEIAKELHLSTRTIEGYREKIMEKTAARNVAGLVVYSIRNGIFKP